MYIYDFLNDLNLLKKENIPNLEKFPKKNSIYYGYCQREDIPPNIINYIDDGKNYLAYSSLNDIKTINYIPIDEEINYINILNNESPLYKRASTPQRDSAFLEAIWLFDELACVKNNPFFDADISIGFQALEIYYNLTDNDIPLLYLFDNIPIKKDIFFAQFNYFIKKYIKHKLGISNNKITNQTISNYKRNLDNAINHYDKIIPNFSKISIITYDKNIEFETFLQQLPGLDKYYDIENKISENFDI